MKTKKLSTIRGNDLQSIQHQGALLSRTLRLKDTGINSKIFHYWKMNGLVGTLEQGKWADISFVELLWLRTLETMRKFGCSLNLLKNIYSDLFLKAYEMNLGKNTLEDNIAYYQNLQRIRPLTIEEKNQLELSLHTLNDSLIMMALRTEISYFYQFILKTINQGIETGIEIFEDESYQFFERNDEAEFLDKSKSVININYKSNNETRPHLYIPFSSMIAEIIEDADKDELIEGIGLITREELWIIKELRNKNVNKITISFDHKSKKPSKIEFDSGGTIDGNKAKEIMRILGLSNYNSIKISTRSGTSLSYNKTVRKYLE